MPKIINETDIENLKALIRNRNSYLDIKEVLDNLDIPFTSKTTIKEAIELIDTKFKSLGIKE